MGLELCVAPLSTRSGSSLKAHRTGVIAVCDNLNGLCFREVASVTVPTFLHTTQKPSFLASQPSLCMSLCHSLKTSSHLWSPQNSSYVWMSPVLLGTLALSHPPSVLGSFAAIGPLCLSQTSHLPVAFCDSDDFRKFWSGLSGQHKMSSSCWPV